jgi:hypothetical protein
MSLDLPAWGPREDLVKAWTARFLGRDEPIVEADATDVRAADASARRASKLPPRIWELEHKLLCPIVGTCLSMPEVRTLARKHGVIPETAGDYEAHVTVVSHCKGRNPVSEAVQKALDRRHALWVGRFAKARSETAAREVWNAALERGEAAGALWGVASCRAATPELTQQVYEDIHMLSHQVGAGVRADLMRTAELEEAVRRLQAQLSRAGEKSESELAHRAARIRYLEKALTTAEEKARENDDLRRRVDDLASGRVLADLQRRLAASEERAAALVRRADRVDALEERLASLGEAQRKLEEDLRQARDGRAALERLLLEEQACGDCALQDACPGPELRGRRLLCVGGRINLQAKYRQLVEKAGGQFIYHDGGKEEALARLQELLGQADAVICPADSVGHPAYYQLKRHCKQARKPCVMLRGSSLASFADGLSRLAAGDIDFGAGAPLTYMPLPTQPGP